MVDLLLEPPEIQEQTSPSCHPKLLVVLEPPEIQGQTSGCCHPKLLVVDLLLETKEIQEQTSCSCHPKLRILPSFVSWIIGLESRRLYLVDLHCAIWCAWHRGFCIIRKPSMKPHWHHTNDTIQTIHQTT